MKKYTKLLLNLALVSTTSLPFIAAGCDKNSNVVTNDTHNSESKDIINSDDSKKESSNLFEQIQKISLEDKAKALNLVDSSFFDEPIENAEKVLNSPAPTEQELTKTENDLKQILKLLDYLKNISAELLKTLGEVKETYESIKNDALYETFNSKMGETIKDIQNRVLNTKYTDENAKEDINTLEKLISEKIVLDKEIAGSIQPDVISLSRYINDVKNNILPKFNKAELSNLKNKLETSIENSLTIVNKRKNVQAEEAKKSLNEIKEDVEYVQLMRVEIEALSRYITIVEKQIIPNLNDNQYNETKTSLENNLKIAKSYILNQNATVKQLVEVLNQLENEVQTLEATKSLWYLKYIVFDYINTFEIIEKDPYLKQKYENLDNHWSKPISDLLLKIKQINQRINSPKFVSSKENIENEYTFFLEAKENARTELEKFLEIFEYKYGLQTEKHISGKNPFIRTIREAFAGNGEFEDIFDAYKKLYKNGSKMITDGIKNPLQFLNSYTFANKNIEEFLNEPNTIEYTKAFDGLNEFIAAQQKATIQLKESIEIDKDKYDLTKVTEQQFYKDFKAIVEKFAVHAERTPKSVTYKYSVYMDFAKIVNDASDEYDTALAKYKEEHKIIVVRNWKQEFETLMNDIKEWYEDDSMTYGFPILEERMSNRVLYTKVILPLRKKYLKFKEKVEKNEPIDYEMALNIEDSSSLGYLWNSWDKSDFGAQEGLYWAYAIYWKNKMDNLQLDIEKNKPEKLEEFNKAYDEAIRYTRSGIKSNNGTATPLPDFRDYRYFTVKDGWFIIADNMKDVYKQYSK